MPDVYPSFSPAQMGNLNKDSTHPNPWYPPTELERFRGGAVPYRIFHSPYDTIGPLKKGKNFLEDDPFLDNCRFGTMLGFKVGALVALNDIVNVNAIDATRARLVYKVLHICLQRFNYIISNTLNYISSKIS